MSDDLQFDAVIPRESPVSVNATAALACAVCHTALDGEYFDANGKQVCRGCSETLARHVETPRSGGVLGRAVVFGAVAAVLGATLYFAVLAISGYEIGLVAIAIGYMVGYGIRMATGGRGGRRFQILALALTYWAVGLAYSSLAIKEMIAEKRHPAPAALSAAPAGGPSRPAGAPSARPAEDRDRPMSGGEFALGLLELLAFTIVLPVAVIFGSLPGGLISAAIVVFGMQQAWRMTAAPAITVSGPYRIGAAPAAG
jgi:hypothetical protein